MSNQLLKYLLGDYYQPLNDHFNLSSRGSLAWYPSAGKDFRDLFYTQPTYLDRYHPNRLKNYQEPGIYIHNDMCIYGEYSMIQLFASSFLYGDKNTLLSISYLRRLPDLKAPFTEEMTGFYNPGKCYGQVYFMMVRVISRYADFSEMLIPVIYIFAENFSLYRDVFKPNHAKFSHLIKVDHGFRARFPQGTATGSWITYLLDEFDSNYLFTDPMLWNAKGDEFALSHIASSTMTDHPLRKFESATIIPSNYWAHKGDVSIFRRKE